MHFAKLISTCFIFLLLSTYAQAQLRVDSTITEEYNNNNLSWGQSNNQDTYSEVIDGQYKIQHLRTEKSWAFWQAFQIDLTQDFSIETKLKQTEGVENYGHGLIWGFKDWKNYNSFLISPNGYVNVNSTIKEQYKEQQAWKESQTVNKASEWNTLKIARIGDYLYFYVNDTEVLKSPTTNFTSIGQYTGFILYHNKSVLVEYITIKGKFPKINLVANAIKGYKPENIGTGVNTDYGELMPVISPDGNTLYFCRRNDPKNKGGVNDDVLYSERLKDGSWGAYKNMGTPINNTGHNFLISVGADNNSLIIGNTYNSDGTQKGSGLAISYRQTTGWSVPIDLNIKNFYNDADYNEYSISPDNQFLVLAVQRKDSYESSRDLYVSFRIDNTSYTEPMNLGNIINTGGDEISPFLASDLKTLYFSSNGHAGYGSSDIFVSRRLDDTWKNWSTPENLGPEINSNAWDAYFTIPASGEEAYLVSSNNKLGKGDIVKIKLAESSKPNPVVLVKGTVLNQKDNTPLESTIHYYTIGNNKEVGSAQSNPVDGKYNIILQAGEKYSFRAEKENFYAVNDFLDLSELKMYQEVEKDLYLVPIEVGQAIRLNNIFFDLNKAVLKTDSYEELNRLVAFLQENPTIEIEISGHTDNSGADDYNLMLSQQRAESVLSYLLEKGIVKSRLLAKGYGENNPVTSNDTELGKAKNRRVEFKIVKQ